MGVKARRANPKTYQISHPSIKVKKKNISTKKRNIYFVLYKDNYIETDYESCQFKVFNIGFSRKQKINNYMLPKEYNNKSQQGSMLQTTSKELK